MVFVFDPELQLPALFPTEASLENIEDVLRHLQTQKQQKTGQLAALVDQYTHPVEVLLAIHELAADLARMRTDARTTHTEILRVTLRIRTLDTAKQNLVLLVKVLKRMQMLVDSYTLLTSVAHTRDYEVIARHLGAVRGLMDYFKAYRLIDDIALLYQRIASTQAKLVDDVFLDFEEAFASHVANPKLRYGCDVLVLADPKNKGKLLTWFNNVQLKELNVLFSTGSEAGALENLPRRYVFFSNVLQNVQTTFKDIFPHDWAVSKELARHFAQTTAQHVSSQLTRSLVLAAVLLEALTATLAFEKQLNDTFGGSEFTKLVLVLFEPHLVTWVLDQDSVLRARFGEALSQPAVPPEIARCTQPAELLAVLQVNNVPNFAQLSTDLFRAFQKSLLQALKLSLGRVLLDLAAVFGKYLMEYHNKVLEPIVVSAHDNTQGIEPIKYLTMVLNTADYVVKNTGDLAEKLTKVIEPLLSLQVTFDRQTLAYFDLISRAVKALVAKVGADLAFSWRLFENKDWDSLDSATDPSNYALDMAQSLLDNHRVLCPLIIREGYVRNYADKLVEQTVLDVASRLGVVRPLSTVAVEQILLDVAVIKRFFTTLPLLADPNYDAERKPEPAAVPKAYLRHLNSQFDLLEALLKLLLTPTLPVDNIVESYFAMVGDRSADNFRKVLHLKSVKQKDTPKYIESFKVQATMKPELTDRSPLLSALPDPDTPKTVPAAKSPEPLDFLKPNLKIGLKSFKDFSIHGDHHVTKFNENFKNFGKFFRKDES